MLSVRTGDPGAFELAIRSDAGGRPPEASQIERYQCAGGGGRTIAGHNVRAKPQLVFIHPNGVAEQYFRRREMQDAALRRVTQSGSFEWPWSASTGIAIIVGASGGGGGGGGALCLEGLNLFGAGGGGGGGGGGATTLKTGEQTYQAFGGGGGDGGGGGGLDDGQPVNGNNGKGCRHGDGGSGGRGAVASPAADRLVSNGGDGGKGFPGETRVVELHGLSKGDRLEVEIGQRGRGGGGGKGFETGGSGSEGADGSVIFVPLEGKGELG